MLLILVLLLDQTFSPSQSTVSKCKLTNLAEDTLDRNVRNLLRSGRRWRGVVHSVVEHEPTQPTAAI
jgi:hypothetical protein